MLRKAHKYRPAGPNPKQTNPLQQHGKRQSRLWRDYLKPSLTRFLHLLIWPFQGLAIITAFSQNRKLRFEEPKAIMERSRWHAAGDCIIHLFPMAITIALLALNFSQYYAGDVGAANRSAQLNALQFAAKLHEVLIAASLSSIVLCCIQYELLQGEGVPFGGLLAGFQVTDLGSLWSPGLWATASVGSAKVRRLLLAILTLTLVTLVAIVGPASAILMLPSLDWWEFGEGATSFPRNTINDVRIFIGANESTFWPSYIALANFYASGCNSTNDTVPISCPLGGFSTLLDLASPDILISDAWTGDIMWNITLPFEAYPGTFSQYLEGVLSNGATSLALTQTTPLAADILLAYVETEFGSGPAAESIRFSLSLKNNSLIPAPSTYATCSTSFYRWENGSLLDAFSRPIQLLFPLKDGSTWSAPSSQLLDVWDNSTEYASVWIEAPDLQENSPSIGVVFARFGNFSEQNGNITYTEWDALLECCSAVSSWEPIQLYTNPLSDTYFHSPTADNVAKNAFDPSYLATLRAIKIDLDWAESAIPANTTLGPFYAKLLGQEHWRTGFDYFPIAVSMVITNILSRIGADVPYIITGEHLQPTSTYGDLVMNDTTDANTGDWTEFKATALRNGYSYSMQGLTRRLATGILLAYLLIVVIYMIAIVWSGWRCIGLKSIVDIVALAVNSTPTRILGNTSAGISRFDTYKHIVKVQAISEQRLGIVFDADMSAVEAEEERFMDKVDRECLLANGVGQVLIGSIPF